MKKEQIVKTQGGLIIKFIPIPALNRLLKQHLSLRKWQKSEAERIEKLRGKPIWEEETQRFRKTLLEKKTSLLKKELDFEAKRRRAFPEPMLRPFPPQDFGIDRILSLTHWRNENLWPDEIWVGHSYIEGGQPVFEPSNLIYPCPDEGKGERWSAWFQNNAVELYKHTEYTIEGDNFTGQMRIRMRERAEGVADISAGGYVSLGVGASVGVWRNIGSAEQPQWSMVHSGSGGTALPHVKTTATGLVSLEPAELWHSWEFTEARPGDVVQTRQHVFVKAVDAHVQMGYNREDCELGNGVGYIYTSMPSLDLQYFNIIKPRLEAIPREFPWR